MKAKFKERKACKGCGLETVILNSAQLCYDCAGRGIADAKRAGKSLAEADTLLKEAISRIDELKLVSTAVAEGAEPEEEYDDGEFEIEVDPSQEEEEDEVGLDSMHTRLVDLEKRIRGLEVTPPIAIKPHSQGKSSVTARRRFLRPVKSKSKKRYERRNENGYKKS